MSNEFSLETRLNWLYIDINSYFATIEQQIHKEIRYKPVAVVPLLSDSTCAIAVSHEAKLKGIKTGTKIYEAKKLCPELICVQANHELYVEYHHKIFNEVDKYLKVDYIFSIDEGACRLTGKYCDSKEAILIANVIKNAIKTNVGDYITCSIGVASNRYLAKIASNMKKPDGLTIIMPKDLPTQIYHLKLNALPGIGIKTQERIFKSGVSSVKQLCALDAKRLKSIWGSIWGEKIWYLIRGADLPLEKTIKSTIGNSQILAPGLREAGSARSILITLILKAASRLRSAGLFSNCILLEVELISKELIKERIKIALSCDNNTFLKATLKSWDNIISVNKFRKIKKLSISLHNLQKAPDQLSFDAFHYPKKQQVLSEAIDYLNKKLGGIMVTIGATPPKNMNKSIVAFDHIPKIHSDVSKNIKS